jgi:hypothetical protein
LARDLLPFGSIRLLGGVNLGELGEAARVQLLGRLSILGLKLLAMAAPRRICRGFGKVSVKKITNVGAAGDRKGFRTTPKAVASNMPT